MSNLEKAITDWREQMRAAGIQSPAMLEELESHLREEIEHRLKINTDEQSAFAEAVAQVGHARILKKEYQKNNGITATLSENRKTYRVLGMLWFIYCLGSFYHLTSGLLSTFPAIHIKPLFLLAWVMNIIYLRGIVASVLLFGGIERERNFIFLLAILDSIGGIAVFLAKPYQPLSCIFTFLGFVTIWLLWPQKTNPASAFNHVRS